MQNVREYKVDDELKKFLQFLAKLKPHVPENRRWTISGLIRDIENLRKYERPDSMEPNSAVFFEMFCQHRLEEFKFLHNRHYPDQIKLREMFHNKPVSSANLQFFNPIFAGWDVIDNMAFVPSPPPSADRKTTRRTQIRHKAASQ